MSKIMKFFFPDVTIKYTGKYPNLCMGDLTVCINGKEYVFEENSLISGGCIVVKEDGSSYNKRCEWILIKYPYNLPYRYKNLVLKRINEEIPHGCCGGCIIKDINYKNLQL